MGKISDLGDKTSGYASNDILVLVDVSDTSQAASGTTKKTNLSKLLLALPSDIAFSVSNPEILGDDTNGVLIIGAGTTNILGGSVRFYGDTHSSKAQDIEFYADATLVLSWDESEGNWDFASQNVKDIGTFASGDITTTGTVQSSITTAVSNGALESGVAANYYSDGIRTTATLTLTNLAVTVGSSEDLGVGVLTFTLPAGDITVEQAAFDIQLAGITQTGETPDIGLGTVVASGIVTDLSGTSTFENIISGVAASDTNGTTTVAHGTTNFQVLTGAAHTVFFNLADTWGANGDATMTVNGTIVLVYRYNFA